MGTAHYGTKLQRACGIYFPELRNTSRTVTIFVFVLPGTYMVPRAKRATCKHPRSAFLSGSACPVRGKHSLYCAATLLRVGTLHATLKTLHPVQFSLSAPFFWLTNDTHNCLFQCVPLYNLWATQVQMWNFLYPERNEMQTFQCGGFQSQNEECCIVFFSSVANPKMISAVEYCPLLSYDCFEKCASCDNVFCCTLL